MSDRRLQNIAALNADPVRRLQHRLRLQERNREPAVRAAFLAMVAAKNADPEHRARRLQILLARFADPEYRARMGWMTDEQVAGVVADGHAGLKAVETGKRWLISREHVSRIWRKHGIHRQPRKPKNG